MIEGLDKEDMTRWAFDRLIDHIVDTHHAYVRQALPAIGAHLATLRLAHGDRHPELAQVTSVFAELSDALTGHLTKEELVLFPYLRDLGRRESDEARGVVVSPFGTVENPIRMMEREHQEAGDCMRRIRELTGGYSTPSDGCTAYAVTMAELADFERDLHQHVHLEDNVLFPRAVALENG